MTVTNTRVFDQGSGQEGLDKLRDQVARMEESLRERPVYLFPIQNLQITMAAETYAENFPFTIRKPVDCKKVYGVLGGGITALDGSAMLSAWYVHADALSDGNIKVNYMTGLTDGLTYNYSLIVVGA